MSLYMLRVEIDGHFHGGRPQRPWAARIVGPSSRFGFEREFVRPMNDWRDARCAWSGNLYGVIATFALREGAMYEVARCRGKPSRRYFAREFYWVDAGEMQERTAEEVLKWLQEAS